MRAATRPASASNHGTCGSTASPLVHQPTPSRTPKMLNTANVRAQKGISYFDLKK